MAMIAYPACFFKEDTGYSVVFPDLNWLATCGDTLEEAAAMAVDCLAGYLYMARRDGDAVAPPSEPAMVDLEAVAAELDVSAQGAFVDMITVDGLQTSPETQQPSTRFTCSGTRFEDFLAEQLRDPEIKAEWDALEPEFALKQAMIDSRNQLPRPELNFESTLSMEEIEANFKDVDVFSGVMEGLEEALVYSKLGDESTPLTDSLVGILSGDYDDRQMLADADAFLAEYAEDFKKMAE